MIIERLDTGTVEISINGSPRSFTGYYVIHKLVNSCTINDARSLLLEVSVSQVDTITNKGVDVPFTDNDSLYAILRDQIFLRTDEKLLTAINQGSDFLTEVAKGNVPKHSLVKKFGENPDVDTTDGFSDIWAGNNFVGGTQKYVAPTQPRIHDMASTDVRDAGTLVSSGTLTNGSANSIEDTSATFITDGVVPGDTVIDDTIQSISVVLLVGSETEITVLGFFNLHTLTSDTPAAAGDTYRISTTASTGASIVAISGINSSFIQGFEYVILNGTTNVATTTLFHRINRMRVAQPGSAQKLIGNLTATAQTDGTVTSAIIDGDNQTLQAIYTLAINQTGYIIEWGGSLSKKTGGVANMRLRVGNFGLITYVFDTHTITTTGSSSFSNDMGPTQIPGLADVFIESDVDTNNMGLSGNFILLLVDA